MSQVLSSGSAHLSALADAGRAVSVMRRKDRAEASKCLGDSLEGVAVKSRGPSNSTDPLEKLEEPVNPHPRTYNESFQN